MVERSRGRYVRGGKGHDWQAPFRLLHLSLDARYYSDSVQQEGTRYVDTRVDVLVVRLLEFWWRGCERLLTNNRVFQPAKMRGRIEVYFDQSPRGWTGWKASCNYRCLRSEVSAFESVRPARLVFI